MTISASGAIKIVPCFKTTDGRYFEEESEAKFHQGKLYFAEWYEKRPLLGMDEGGYVGSRDMIDFLVGNQIRIRMLIDGD